jgi:hypothetical protein
MFLFSAAKPKRAAYTDEEKEFLFTSYRENPYPSVSRRTEIADFLKKPFSQISCWFKNQRARSGDFKKGTSLRVTKHLGVKRLKIK